MVSTRSQSKIDGKGKNLLYYTLLFKSEFFNKLKRNIMIKID